MKNVVSIAVAALAVFSVMAEQTNSTRRVAQRISPADLQRVAMKLTGGRIQKPESGKGFIAIVNAQKQISGQLLNDMAKSLTDAFHFKTVVLPSNALSVQEAEKALKATGASHALFVVSEPLLPGTLVALENRWAFVNVAALSQGNPPSTILTSRTEKAILRAFAFLCGAADSPYFGPIMGPVANPSELDAISMPERTPVALSKQVAMHLRAAGLEPIVVATYKKACEEGWAPAPTNDFQKAIWDKAKSDKERGPTNPIKIAPPAKK